MTSYIARRAAKLQPSATIAVGTKARELIREGRDVISLGIGEPCFDTPDFIKEAGIQAIEEGMTKYTDVDGIPRLKNAIVHKFKRDNQLDYSLNQVLATAGSKIALYNLAQAVLNEGDEVIIPAPYWVSYPQIMQLAEAKSVFIETSADTHFKISPEQLDRAITAKTKLLIFNAPSNPSGMVYTANELKALATVLLKYPNVLIASDDIYEYVLWNGPFVNLVNVCPELKSRCIVLNGASKAYAMTGWRIGYAAGPEEIIQTMKKIQAQNTNCPASMSQVAAARALEAERAEYQYMYDGFKERHDIAYEALNAMPGVTCLPSDGTFYLFPVVKDAIAALGLKSDIEFATYILEKTFVTVVPGTPFGTPGHIRISSATSIEKLREGLDRIANLLK